MRRIVWPLPAVAMLLAMLLTACAGPGASIGPIAHPAGNDLILRMSYSGGFVGPGLDVMAFPPFTLLGDGRVITPGPQTDVYPGSSLPAVNVRRLTEAGIQAVLTEVSQTALFGESVRFSGAQACVMDAGDTVFTLHAGGREVTVRVYGLGTIDSTSGCQGFSSTEQAAHRTLTHLLQRLATLEQWLPASAWADAASHPYQPEALRLVVRNADADPPNGSGSGDAPVDWPDSSDPATFGQPGPFEGQRCDVVSGQRAEDWHTALASATQLTRFAKGGHRYQVTVRFLLPDEPWECPKLPT